MRKKSHLSLTTYLIENMNESALCEHKGAFYVGSILPDCVPSFLFRKHCIEDTFSILRDEIVQLTEMCDKNKGIDSYYCRHLGIITHYVADYFTFPHNNSIFEGKMKEHCTYEKELKIELKKYVKSSESERKRDAFEKEITANSICLFIKDKHDEYLAKVKQNVQEDIMYIVELCHSVVNMLLSFFDCEVSYERVRVDNTCEYDSYMYDEYNRRNGGRNRRYQNYRYHNY